MLANLKLIYDFIRTHPIGSRVKCASWKRFFAWQLASRLLPFPVHLPWIEDTWLVTERGMAGATGNWYCGLHEFADMGLLLHYFGGQDAQEGFLDVGANVGSYTILASGVCGQPSLALEPLPATFERLRRNVSANQIDDLVDARCCAVGASQGSIRFTSDQDTMNKVVDKKYSGPAVEVQMVCLDDLFTECKVLPAFWKVDVEGFEKEVIAGARRCLGDPQVKVVILEEDDQEISFAMQECGFSRAAYDPFSRKILINPDVRSCNNNLWLRDPQMIEKRCRASRSIDVMGVEI